MPADTLKKYMFYYEKMCGLMMCEFKSSHRQNWPLLS